MPRKKRPPTPKEILEQRKVKFRIFYLKTGVYITILIGVMTNWLFPNMRISLASADIDVTMVELGPAHLVAGVIVSTIIYTLLEKREDLAKIVNPWRLARSAFLMGFFSTEIISRFTI